MQRLNSELGPLITGLTLSNNPTSISTDLKGKSCDIKVGL